jgi:hypothetical protein
MTTVVERSVTSGWESVRTRISWGAIAAGTAVAMAVFTLLMSLGIAVGMSVSDDVNSQALGTRAGAWGFIALLVSLFAGGWVTTQVTVGESRTEAILYGVVLWATTSVLMMWLAANGVQAGMSTVMATHNVNTELRLPTVSETDMTPQERQAAAANAREAGREGSWWAFAGILFSMVASVGGALVGPVELTVRREYRNTRDVQTPVI